MDLQAAARQSFANHGILPFQVSRIQNVDGKGVYLYINNLPDDLDAKEWLLLLESSVPAGMADTYLFIGACTIVSVAVAAVLGHDVLRVSLPDHKHIHKVYAPATIEVADLQSDDIDTLHHTDHLVVTKLVNGIRQVLDLTGAQFQWDASMLNQWVPLDAYLEQTGSTLPGVTNPISSPFSYLTKNVTGEEISHQACMWAMFNDLKNNAHLAL